VKKKQSKEVEAIAGLDTVTVALAHYDMIGHKVKTLTSDKGTIRKVVQHSEYYSLITDGIQGVKGCQPKLLFYDRSETLDKDFDAGKIKVFAELASKTIGGMR
jgi:hypothetical protein